MLKATKIKQGMTLSEILLACVLMACSFLPIMNLMGSSISVSEKDEATLRAVSLCQEKLNAALQIPYEFFKPGTYGDTATKVFSTTKEEGNISVSFGPETIDGMVFSSKILIEPYEVTFEVPMCNFDEKFKDMKRVKDSGGKLKLDPASWKWDTKKIPASNLARRYTVTVKWTDKGAKNEKFYSLSTIKANIRKKSS